MIEEAGKVVKTILEELGKIARPGTATLEFDKKAEEIIGKFRCRSAFKGYRGYPGTVCVSVNEEVVHGIPGNRRLGEGDIVGIDVGIEKDGYFADSAITLAIGDLRRGAKALDLIETTREALRLGIREAVEGNRLFDISHAIQRHAESRGYSVVRDFVGHGIGKKLHEDPSIPNFGAKGTGPRLKSGMVLAIEPMINEGGWEVEVLDDGWTAVTKDKKLSAHFEHTIAITENDPRILT